MIDQIAIRVASGFNLVTPAAWQSLDKAERAALIRAGRVEFLEEGETVPVREALLMLKSAFSVGVAA